ncbi:MULTISPECIES: tyrosine--tRNA ligase [Photorhabdus]|uniref:Tyrosine--tRNA ligase n=2 Tax=Photorhabdus asymbiotica TaxID=291112 RepID=C7BGQ4_PHOAA|nr:tyrosine--tRNA ligase [Photorhabdus asymbiotica]RKS54601.1 tyrosyl-tRNA synthetase [Photorhabdus asymbiotica]CAQ82233.1 tyrosyl-trna synthetase 2 [Photorhabdus asymbiotica]
MKENIDKLLSNIAIMEPPSGLQDKLALARQENRKLTIKLGFDPTAPDLHLGHSVVLQKLKDFQDEGHRIVVIIGDFTAGIGDPTGRNKLRPPLTLEQINKNSQTYINQLAKVINIENIEIRKNSEWFSNMPFSNVIKLISKITLAQIMHRDDFKTRFESKSPVHLHEIIYPILQGYDSVMIDADIELGGTDQLFNNLVGRTLQEAYEKKGQIVITMPLLEGLDGIEKMSKSKNNYIGLTDNANDMYGKVMSIPDSVIINYLTLATDMEAEKQSAIVSQLELGLNPMKVKKDIAYNIVKRYHDDISAKEAAEHFERVVQKRTPEEADHDVLILPKGSYITLLDLCSVALPTISRSELRRLIRSGAVRVDKSKEDNEIKNIEVIPGMLIWIGKRYKFRIDG